jgi:hypothetical protein
MEIDAVLKSLVLEPNQGDAGGFCSALGFKVFEERGSINSKADIRKSAFNGKLRLFDLLS